MGDCGRSSWRDTLIKQTIAAQEAQESTTDMARSTRLVIESSLRRKGQTEGHG